MKRLFARVLPLAIAVGLAGPSTAEDLVLTCSNAGNTYKVGEFACIAACHGARRLARCDKLTETATWTYVSDVCPSALFVPGPPDDASQIPAVAAMSPLPGPLKISEIVPEMAQRIAALNTELTEIR